MALPPLDGEHVQGHTHRTGWRMLGKAWKIVLHQSEHTGKVDVQTGELPLHCHPRASSAKTRGFHTQLDEGPETP